MTVEKLQAIIKNGKVENVIVADVWPDGIDVTSVTPRPGPGWTYDGATFTAPPPPPPSEVTQIERADLLARMTPVEVHGWIRAAKRAEAAEPAAVVAKDRNALYAWTRWQAMQGDVDMASDDIKGLAQVWIALGMSQARAIELLTPMVR